MASLWKACAAVLALGASGCFSGGSLGLPPGVAAVEENSSEFKQSSSHPLHEAAPGTVIDSLDQLYGCWGAFAGPEFVGPGLNSNAEYYRFDLDNSSWTYQVVQRAPFSLGLELAVAAESTYSIEIVAPDRIQAELLSSRIMSNLPGSSSLPGFNGEDEAEPGEVVFELQITLDGDAFKFGDSLDASPDFGAPHRANLTFFRFECPEAE